MTTATTGPAPTRLADVAVAIPTVLRPTLLRAVRSVFRQTGIERIQVLIGIDWRQGDESCLDILRAECPGHVTLTILDLGYSTSRRHGGFYSNHFSGALRTILSYAANSRHVAYLDDDDWWARDHLSTLLAAVEGKDWAFSYRWLVDRETAWPICRDEWDSLGPGRGINQARFGGFVSPSNLMLNKEACHFVLPYWSLSPFPDGTGEDRLIFKALLQHTAWAASERYSCFYDMPREVQDHLHHAREFAARHITWIHDRAQVDAILRLTRDAESALASGALDDAARAARRALALNPYHAPALLCLARTEWRAGRGDEARALIAQAMAVADHDPAIAAAWAEMGANAPL